MKEDELQVEWRKCIDSFEYWRDKYVLRKRTYDDWQEICRKIAEVQNISLRESVEIYKQDRQRWVDWYNKEFVYNK